MFAPRCARVPRFWAKTGKHTGKRLRAKFGRFCELFAGQDLGAFFGRKVRSIFKQEKEAVPKTALASIHFGRQRRPFCCDTLYAFLYRCKMRCRIRGIDAFVGAVFVRLYR